MPVLQLLQGCPSCLLSSAAFNNSRFFFLLQLLSSPSHQTFPFALFPSMVFLFSSFLSLLLLFSLKSAKFTFRPKQCYLTQNARSSSIHRCLKSSNSKEYLYISMKFLGFSKNGNVYFSSVIRLPKGNLNI